MSTFRMSRSALRISSWTKEAQGFSWPKGSVYQVSCRVNLAVPQMAGIRLDLTGDFHPESTVASTVPAAHFARTLMAYLPENSIVTLQFYSLTEDVILADGALGASLTIVRLGD